MEQRLKDKQSVLNALRAGKTGLELCQLYQDYFKKYLIDKEIVAKREENAKTVYDVLTEPLLSSI